MKLHHYIPIFGLAITNLWSIEILQAKQVDLYENLEQMPDTMHNKTDANGQKQWSWRIYSWDTLKAEGNYIDNKKNWIRIEYFPDYKKKNEITFNNGIAQWPAKFYYTDGTLREEWFRAINKRVGEYQYYHENGQTSYDWHYDESGKRQWKQTYYYENWNVMIQWEWVNGQEEWAIKIYYEDGSLKQDKYLNAGKIDIQKTKNYEPGQQYHPDANKKRTITQVTNKETEQLWVFRGTGQHTLYVGNTKEKISKTGYFENGKLIDGKEFEYDETGKLQKIHNYKGGKLVDTIQNTGKTVSKQ